MPNNIKFVRAQEFHAAEFIINIELDMFYQLLSDHKLKINADKSAVVDKKDIEENLTFHTKCVVDQLITVVVKPSAALSNSNRYALREL